MAIGRPLNLTANVATKNISVIATSGQTQFTVTGGYRINEIAVYRNGTRLVDGRDFTATDGSIVTLLSGATVGDSIEFQIFDSFNVANTIKPNESDQTINGNLTVTGTLSGLTSVTGASIGIQSAGTHIGIAQTINFIGAGNTVVTNGNTIDVSISGSGGGGLGTAINYADGTSSPFSYIDPEATVGEDMLLDDSSAGESDTYIVSVIPTINIGAGIAVTVGSGKTMVIDVLQIGDL
jgi:hypothetical protein